MYIAAKLYLFIAADFLQLVVRHRATALSVVWSRIEDVIATDVLVVVIRLTLAAQIVDTRIYRQEDKTIQNPLLAYHHYYLHYWLSSNKYLSYFWRDRNIIPT